MKCDALEKFPYLNTLMKIQLDRLVGRKDVRCIVDVGAFDGELDIHFTQEYPKAMVHAIEPCKIAYDILCKGSKFHPNIKPHRLAISNVTGKLLLHIEDKDDGTASQSNSIYESFIAHKAGDISKQEKVSCKTLSDFCQDEGIKDIQLLLMNCEGGEFKIFEDPTACDVLSRVRVLSLALHGKSPQFTSQEYADKKIQINKLLVDLGFKIVYGDVLKGTDRLKLGHIVQLWVK